MSVIDAPARIDSDRGEPGWPELGWPVPEEGPDTGFGARPRRSSRSQAAPVPASGLARRCADLAGFALLHGVPAALLEHVARHASEHHLDEGQALFFKNDRADFLPLVLEGRIHELLYGPCGQELIVAIPGPGEAIDESALLDRGARSFTAIAGAPTRVLVLHRRHFATLAASPLVRERAAAQLCTRLRRIIDSLESIGLYRLESRLARHLLSRLAPGSGRDRSAEITLPSTQGVLAAMLNVSRSKLNAQLQAWRRSGLACRHGNVLHVHDLDVLRGKAFAPPRARSGANEDVARAPQASIDRPARSGPGPATDGMPRSTPTNG